MATRGSYDNHGKNNDDDEDTAKKQDKVDNKTITATTSNMARKSQKLHH